MNAQFGQKVRRGMHRQVRRILVAVMTGWVTAWISVSGQAPEAGQKEQTVRKPIDINSTTPPPTIDPSRPLRAIWRGKPDPTAACPTFWDFAQFRKCALVKMKAFNPARTPDGKPDMNGRWQLSRGQQDIEEIKWGQYLFHPHINSTVVEPADGRIPYQPWARALKNELPHTYITPSTMCLPRGPHRFVTANDLHIIQQPHSVVLYQEREHLARIVPMNGRPHLASHVKLWFGTARGHWEGNTLVIETANINDLDWFDNQGSLVSDEIRQVERFTFVDANTLLYEQIVTDPKVLTQPMPIAHALRRSDEQGVELEMLEDDRVENCHHELEHFYARGLKTYPGLAVVAPERK